MTRRRLTTSSSPDSRLLTSASTARRAASCGVGSTSKENCASPSEASSRCCWRQCRRPRRVPYTGRRPCRWKNPGAAWARIAGAQRRARGGAARRPRGGREASASRSARSPTGSTAISRAKWAVFADFRALPRSRSPRCWCARAPARGELVPGGGAADRSNREPRVVAVCAARCGWVRVASARPKVGWWGKVKTAAQMVALQPSCATRQPQVSGAASADETIPLALLYLATALTWTSAWGYLQVAAPMLMNSFGGSRCRGGRKSHRRRRAGRQSHWRCEHDVRQGRWSSRD